MVGVVFQKDDLYVYYFCCWKISLLRIILCLVRRWMDTRYDDGSIEYTFREKVKPNSALILTQLHDSSEILTLVARWVIIMREDAK